MKAIHFFNSSLLIPVVSCTLRLPSPTTEANHTIPKEQFAYTMQAPEDSEGIRDSFRACYEKLCPLEERYEFSRQKARWMSFPHFRKSDMIFSEFDNLDSLILEHLTLEKSMGETELSIVIDSEGKLPKDILSDPKAALTLGLRLARSGMSEVDFSTSHYKVSEDRRGHEIVLDEKAFEAMAEGPYKNLIPLTRRLIQSPELGQLNKISHFEKNIELYYSLLPGNIQDHIEHDRVRLRGSLQRIKAVYPPVETIISRQELKGPIMRVLNDNGYDRGDLLEFAELVPILAFIANLLEDDSQRIDFDLGETFEGIYRDRDFAQEATAMKERLDKVDIEGTRSRMIHTISGVYHGSPRSHEIGQVQQKIEKAVQDIENHVLTRLSPSVQAGLSNELKHIKWIIPENRNVFLRKTVETLEEHIVELKKDAEQFERMPLMRAMALVSFDPEETLSEGEFSGTNDLFKQLNSILEPMDVSYSYASPPNVVVSLMALRTKVGIGLIKHELGHVINRFLDENHISDSDELQYLSIHECLNSMHNERPETVEIDLASGKKTQQGFYFSEDFADLISSTAEQQQQETSFTCMLYPDADFRSLIRDDKTEDHSGALFRILHTQIVDKEKIPDECQNFLDNYYPQFKFRDCFGSDHQR